jgi:hypothetical protein
MFVYACACMYAYVCMHMYVYEFVCVCVCVHVYVYMRTHITAKGSGMRRTARATRMYARILSPAPNARLVHVEMVGGRPFKGAGDAARRTRACITDARMQHAQRTHARTHAYMRACVTHARTHACVHASRAHARAHTDSLSAHCPNRHVHACVHAHHGPKGSGMRRTVRALRRVASATAAGGRPRSAARTSTTCRRRVGAEGPGGL